MIRGILFDYDGTLSNRTESAYFKYRDMCHHLFPEMDTKGIEFEGIVQRCMTWDELGTISKSHVFEEIRKHYLPDLDVDQCVRDWYADFDQFQIEAPGCHDILTKLKQRYKLGCVTNGPASTQNAKIDRLGLRGFFDTVLVSETFGVKKPDKRIYEQAARDLNLECREIAFVGDTFCTDIVGAVRAGMMPIWYFNDPLRISLSDVRRIHDFQELEDLFLVHTEWNV